MKTGCSTEERQLGTVHALQNFLAFATVVTWQMLCLRDAARRPEPVRADQVLTPLQVTVLCGLRPRLKADCLAAEALRAIAMMGGFMGRKGDGNPGWRTLWAGFEKLLMAENGFLLAQGRFGYGRAPSRGRGGSGQRAGEGELPSSQMSHESLRVHHLNRREAMHLDDLQ
jgi:hypothetical protein